jgi:hypothetical protein
MKEAGMSRKRFTAEKIIGILQDVIYILAEGERVEIRKPFSTYPAARKQFGTEFTSELKAGIKSVGRSITDGYHLGTVSRAFWTLLWL